MIPKETDAKFDENYNKLKEELRYNLGFNYNKSGDKFRNSSNNFNKYKGLSEYIAEKISDVLAKFSEKGLLPDINTEFHEPEHIINNPDRIMFIGTKSKSVVDGIEVNGDVQGARITKAIVAAANSEGISITHGTKGGDHIKVPFHEKTNPMRSAIKLLKALEKYAGAQDNKACADLAKKSAADIEFMALTAKSDKPR